MFNAQTFIQGHEITKKILKTKQVNHQNTQRTDEDRNLPKW